MNNKSAQWCVVVSVALVCAQMAAGQTSAKPSVPGASPSEPAATMLTRSQWLKKVGDAAKTPELIRGVMVQLSDGEKIEFTRRVLKAITRLPLSPEEKQALLIKASIECIRSTPLKNDERYKAISEIIATVPVEFLPGVIGELAKRFDPKVNKLSEEQFKQMADTTLKLAVERNKSTDDPAVRNTFVIGELSKRFDPKVNKLSEEQFKQMADTTLKLAVERNKSTDDPAVRNTFAMLLFLNATTQPQTENLQALLLTRLPNDTGRELAKGYIVEAQKGNYEPLLNATDTTVRVTPPPVAISRVGVSQMEQLLVDVGGLTGSFEIRTQSFGESHVFGASDVGIQTVPRGYPNQGTLL